MTLKLLNQGKETIARRLSVRALARASAAFIADRNGGTLIEFALLSPLYMALVIATLQMGLIYFDQQALQTATDKIARQEMTGQLTFNTTGMTAAQISAQIASAFAADLQTYLNSPIDPTQVNISFFIGNNFTQLAGDQVSTTATYDAQGHLITSGYTSGSGYSSSNIVQACQFGVLKLYYEVPTMFTTGPIWMGTFNVGDAQHNRQIVGTAVFKSEAFNGVQC